MKQILINYFFEEEEDTNKDLHLAFILGIIKFVAVVILCCEIIG